MFDEKIRLLFNYKTFELFLTPGAAIPDYPSLFDVSPLKLKSLDCIRKWGTINAEKVNPPLQESGPCTTHLCFPKCIIQCAEYQVYFESNKFNRSAVNLFVFFPLFVFAFLSPGVNFDTDNKIRELKYIRCKRIIDIRKLARLLFFINQNYDIMLLTIAF